MIKICYTGHRPELLGGYDWNTERNLKIFKRLLEDALNFIQSQTDNHFKVYFGGALGIDQMAFTAWLYIQENVKLQNVKIELILCIPFTNYDSKWLSQTDKDRLRHQIKVADKVIYVDTEPGYECKYIPVGEYHVSKNHIRNNYMIDNVDVVFAVWNGQKEGGTASCVRYAQKKGKQIIILNPNDI